jgi:hypothetical protein
LLTKELVKVIGDLPDSRHCPLRQQLTSRSGCEKSALLTLAASPRK